jgi:nucleoid DNA-binding protein
MLNEELLERLSDKTGFTKTDVRAVMRALAEVMHDAAVDHETVKIPKLGILKFKTFKARRGYAAKLGKYVDYPETIKMVFSLSKTIRKARADDLPINDEDEWSEE